MTRRSRKASIHKLKLTRHCEGAESAHGNPVCSTFVGKADKKFDTQYPTRRSRKASLHKLKLTRHCEGAYAPAVIQYVQHSSAKPTKNSIRSIRRGKPEKKGGFAAYKNGLPRHCVPRNDGGLGGYCCEQTD